MPRAFTTDAADPIPYQTAGTIRRESEREGETGVGTKTEPVLQEQPGTQLAPRRRAEEWLCW